MVRVISSGFSTPRSRHSSGEEMIDRFAALKAISALNELQSKQFDENSNEIKERTLVIDLETDTNDSFSGLDSEEDRRDIQGATGSTTNQNDVVKRKERRRERNKVSAQNYRVRRREQSAAAEKTLEQLEVQNKDLLEKLRHLEAEKHIVEEYLKSCVKIPWCPYHHPCKPTNSQPPHPSPPHTHILPPKHIDGINGNLLPITNPLPLSSSDGSMESSSGSGLDNACAMDMSVTRLDNAGAVGTSTGGIDIDNASATSMGIFENNNMPLAMRKQTPVHNSMSVGPRMLMNMRVGGDMSLRMSGISPIPESSGSSVS